MIPHSLYNRLFAAFLARVSVGHDGMVAPWKENLFAGLHGTVLEIGPGTGINLRYLPRDVQWIGIEPNAHMHPYLRAEARRLAMPIDLRQGHAESLDLPDASVDAVISTLVLCSVRSPAAVLAEVARVLRPTGRFVFIEHVAAPEGTWTRTFQHLIRPLWRTLGDGCTPTRDTAATIRATFPSMACEPFTLPLPIVGPHIAGTAQAAAQHLVKGVDPDGSDDGAEAVDEAAGQDHTGPPDRL